MTLSFMHSGFLTATDRNGAETTKSLKAVGRGNSATAQGSRPAATPLIYAVDDRPELTELYITLLQATGYSVRVFNDRARALSALTEDRPDLLIADFLGHAVPVDMFLRRCRAVHPTLRILMVSGLGFTEVTLSQAIPDRFVQKPFTPEEFRQEVAAALAAH
jgi:DNA-binding response OmpR family regulator